MPPRQVSGGGGGGVFLGLGAHRFKHLPPKHVPPKQASGGGVGAWRSRFCIGRFKHMPPSKRLEGAKVAALLIVSICPQWRPR